MARAQHKAQFKTDGMNQFEKKRFLMIDINERIKKLDEEIKTTQKNIDGAKEN
jgi:hypothetical protein